MMDRKTIVKSALLAATLMLSFPTYAQEETDTGDNAPSPFAAQETPGGSSSVPVISGGIGEEMDHLKSIQNQYDLKLLITEANGVFLSDIGIQIQDKKGNTLVDTVTEGPVLLADLPTGAYKLKATRHEEIKEQKINVTKGKLKAYQITFHATDPRESGDARTVDLK